MAKTVVVSGASSGMGREVALRLARRGDAVVLGARRGGALDELVRECERAGGRAAAVPMDVTDPEAVEELAQQAVAAFGRIDGWVHTAAVLSYGRVWEQPARALKRVTEVILGGSMLVAREAVRRMRDQPEGGTLVLVSSALGKAPLPYLGAYSAAKHGLVGLAASLRADLKEAQLDGKIRVVNVMPPTTDTPFYAHAANYAGRAPRPPPPVYRVETMGEAIVGALDSPEEPEVVVGAAGKLIVSSYALSQGAYERLAVPYVRTMFFDEPAPPTDGNLFEPMPQGTSSGGGWGASLGPQRRAPRPLP